MRYRFICAPVSGNGGTETVVVAVVNHLAELNKNVDLFLTLEPENRSWLTKINSNVNIVHFTAHTKIEKLFYLNRIFYSTSNDDRLIILGANIIKLAYFYRKILKKKWKIYSWIHYSLYNQNLFNPKNILYADMHLAISTSIKKQLIELGEPEKKIRLIFNPISKYKGEKNIPDNTSVLRVVYVGKIMLTGQKNLIELFNAVKNYKGKIHIDLFGADTTNGEIFNFLKNEDLIKFCTFHKWTDDPWKEIITKIHPNCLVLTSKYEGLPMVMLEALSRGIPCIVADFYGSRDIINSQNGVIYKSRNTNDFVNKLEYVNSKSYNSESIARSINKFYEKEYFERLDKILGI